MLRSSSASVSLSSITSENALETNVLSEESASEDLSRERSIVFLIGQEAETSTPKETIMSQNQILGKENIMENTYDSKSKTASHENPKPRKSRVLKNIRVENSSQPLQSWNKKSIGSAASPKVPKKKTKPKRSSFEILRSDGETNDKKMVISSLDQTQEDDRERIEKRVSNSPDSVAMGRSGLRSPEYNGPGEFYDAVNWGSPDNNLKITNTLSTYEGDASKEDQFVPGLITNPPPLEKENRRRSNPPANIIDLIMSEFKDSQLPESNTLKTQEENIKLIERILEIVSDPWNYFTDKSRDCSSYSDHSLCYLKTKFRKHYTQTICDALLFHSHNLYLAYKYLMKKNRGIKLRLTNRSLSECNANRPSNVDPRFLLEVAFIENEEEMKIYIKNKKMIKKNRIKEAARSDMLLVCKGCHQGDLLREDVIQCAAGHIFCKGCVAKNIELGIKKGECQIGCAAVCVEKYPLAVVQGLLTQERFSKLIELYEAHNFPKPDGLVRCSFCNFVYLLPQEVQVISCLNPRCLKQSRRICNKVDSLSLISTEAKPTETGSRISAIGVAGDELLRSCWKCNRNMLKEEGCNEMVCSCGSKMCYLCREPVKNHSHFYLYEPENGSECPLYSSELLRS